MCDAAQWRTERLRRFTQLLVFVSVALLTLNATAGAATRYDPRLRFRTISTSRFDIHFHQREESLARRLASFIEDAAASVDRAVGPPIGRVQVILVDQSDLSNGWATPLPYNTIEITAAAPSAETSIGNTDDWLQLVFTHEYTHIAHLSRAKGWIGGLRRGFGRLPVLFPNLYQPVWGIEGIAVWEESGSTQQGRIPAGDFRLLIQRAAAAGRFEQMDRVNGGNVDWPGGAGPYLYGAYFHQFLSQRYGGDSIRALADETSRRVPYLTSRAYRKVYGRSLGELWKEFAAATTRDATASDAAAATRGVVRLTHHGYHVSGPRYAADGRIFYSAADPHHFPALMELPAGGALPRRVANRYLGNRIAVLNEDDVLVVDELDLVRNVGVQSDLYLVNPRDGSRQRLTREARALDPDISQKTRTVVCAVQMSDRRTLATYQLRHGGQPVLETLVSAPDTDFAAPRWSPDGRWIAAERRRLRGPAEIVLVNVSDRSVRTITSLPDARSASPTWTSDGSQVLFSSAAEGEPFRIYRVDVASGELTMLEGTGASAQSPDVSPDGRTLVFVGYTVDGYDLFSMSLVDARWIPVNRPRAPASSAIAAEQGAAASEAITERSYSPWRTLAPRFWTPTLESDAGELVVGAATGSVDALGRHAYGVEAGWGARARPDWRIAYAYDRWWPTFFAAISDDTDPWRDGEHRAKEVNAGVLLRVSRVRYAHRTLAAFHIADDTFTCAGCVLPIDVQQKTAAPRIGWEFNNSRSFGYSISGEEGGRFAVTAEVPRKAFGSDGNAVALTADARRYWRLGPQHAVVAVRGAAARSWGDRDAQRLFSASGNGPQPGGFGFGLDAIGLLRGFNEDDVVGTRAVTVNVDYRVPLMRIDRGVGTVPVFIRSIHGAVFMDAGHAWIEPPRWTDVRTSIGAEISADTVLGFAVPVTFTAGAAWRREGNHGDRGVVVFGRVGRAF